MRRWQDDRQRDGQADREGGVANGEGRRQSEAAHNVCREGGAMQAVVRERAVEGRMG